MGLTIKISQKHVERFIFIVIILVLAGLLVIEKMDLKILSFSSGSETVATTTLAASTTTLAESTTTTSSAATTTQAQATSTSTLSSSSTTTTNNAVDITFAVPEIETSKTDSTKGKIDSISVVITNGLDIDKELTLKYYLYDDLSDSSERVTAKRPYIEIGAVNAGETFEHAYVLNRTVFNLGYEKTMKFELTDAGAGIKKTVIKKFTIE